MNQIKKYDAIIIGFGKGGKTLAGALGTSGRKTALIEQSPQMYGGTCINVGCIPTKFLAHKAKGAHTDATFEEKQAYYQTAVEQELALTQKLRAKNLEKAAATPNVTVITGTAKMMTDMRVSVETSEGTLVLEGQQIFINTGSVPILPSIEGLRHHPLVVTSEGLLRQKRLPEQLVIIGGGYIGVEFASIYAQLGSQVTMIQNDNRFLPREDADIAHAVFENLQNRGVAILTETDVQSVLEREGKALVTVTHNGESRSITADTVLVATGRRPNTEGLGLESVGVQLTDRGGIVTDEHRRTTVPNIYAMGDVVGSLQFTYISLEDYRIVRSAVLGDGNYTVNSRVNVPYSVFLDPPFSRVGLSKKEAVDAGYSVRVTQLPAAAIPKALVLQQPSGLLKAVIDAETGRILGAHLFCEESHEMINIVKLAMDAQLPYTALRDAIFTHPTMSEALNDLFQG